MNNVSPISCTSFHSRTVVENIISELRTTCFCFKCLSDSTFESDFTDGDNFDVWLGLFYRTYDSFHDQVNRLCSSFQTYCDDVSDSEREVYSDN